MAWGDIRNIITDCGYYWDYISQEWKNIPVDKFSPNEILAEWKKNNPEKNKEDFRITGNKDISI
jgi:hypothetical protein